MKRNPFHFVLIISMLTILISGCTSSGDGGSDGDECDGPVPCLTKNWGDSEYWFEEADGDPVLLRSTGEQIFVGGVTTDEYIYVLVGDPTNCYTADLFDGAIDWNGNEDDTCRY